MDAQQTDSCSAGDAAACRCDARRHARRSPRPDARRRCGRAASPGAPPPHAVDRRSAACRRSRRHACGRGVSRRATTATLGGELCRRFDRNARTTDRCRCALIYARVVVRTAARAGLAHGRTHVMARFVDRLRVAAFAVRRRMPRMRRRPRSLPTPLRVIWYSTAAGTCRSGRAARQGFFDANGVTVQLAYTPIVGVPRHGAARRQGRHRAAPAIDNRRRVPGRARAKRRSPTTPTCSRSWAATAASSRSSRAPAIDSGRRAQGQDGVGRRDDRPASRSSCASSSRAAASPRPTSRYVRARRHREPLPRPGRRQARRDAAAHAVRAPRRRAAASTVIATAETLGAYQGTVGLRAAKLGARRTKRRWSASSAAYKAAHRLARTTARTATSSKRCSSPTSAT